MLLYQTHFDNSNKRRNEIHISSILIMKGEHSVNIMFFKGTIIILLHIIFIYINYSKKKLILKTQKKDYKNQDLNTRFLGSEPKALSLLYLAVTIVRVQNQYINKLRWRQAICSP